MKELRLGKVTSKELAEWFGISYGSFRVTKDKKLEELRLYCTFEEIYGGVNIIEINENNLVYIKDGKKNYELIKSSFDEAWSENGIDTCTNVAIKIYDKHKNELTIADSTAYNYTIRARNELYGRPFVDVGELGHCMYLWCRKDVATDGTIIYTEFTDEEQEIKKKLMMKYFSTDVEKEIMVAEMVDNGEITEAEAYRVLRNMKNLNGAGFMAFKYELEAQIGTKVARGTILYRKDNEGIEFGEETKELTDGSFNV